MEHHPLWRVRPNHLATVGDDHLLSDLEHVPTEQQRSEEHTSELQSPCNLVCRLLLEKKKQTKDEISPAYTSAMISVLQCSFEPVVRTALSAGFRVRRVPRCYRRIRRLPGRLRHALAY